MNHQSVASALLLAATAAAQTSNVEWTSFEDRIAHAMAIDPNGSLVMYGGRVPSTGRDLGDTLRFANSTWSQAAPAQSPPPLSSHAMAGSMIGGSASILLFGGRTGSVPSGQTWVWGGNNWSESHTGPGPSARFGHAMVNDTRNNRIIMFGGEDATGPLNDTWIFVSATSIWLHVSTTTQPSARRDHAMAFDPLANNNNGEVVLFGGTGFRGETWAFDGTNWTQVAVTGPAPRRSAGMAFEANHQHVVLYGGQLQNLQFPTDTWTFDRTSSSWTQMSPAQSPSARWLQAMATGPGGEVILHGGQNSSGQTLTGTWTWDGVNWAKLPLPSSRICSAMAFDNSGTAIMFGGTADGQPPWLGDTWKLEGLSWKQPNPPPTTSPTARAFHGMAFDSNRNRMVLFGGNNGVDLNDTWEWTGTNWSLRVPTLSPPPLAGMRLAHDEARQQTVFAGVASTWKYSGVQNTWLESRTPGHRWAMGAVNDATRVLMFGGANPITLQLLNDTWQWNGVEWQQLQPAASPSPRLSFGMAYDSARNRVVLYGGNTGSPVFADTWLWDGGDWVQQAAASPPGPKSNMAMAYDSARHVVVLFGGADGTLGYTNDTWEWNGSAWTQRTDLATSPAPRNCHRMAYDAGNGYMVMFGGYDGGSGFQDTWTYDGVDWTEWAPAISPPTSSWFHATAYDPISARVVINGGNINDSWAWDGANWSRVNTVNPGLRGLSALVPNVSSRPGLLMYAGANNPDHFQDTWLLEGSTWTEMSSGFPANLVDYSLAYDSLRQRTVLFGGQDRTTAVLSQDTWEWDGANWLRRNPGGPLPPPRLGAIMDCDKTRGLIVLSGGVTANGSVDDTWEWNGLTWTERLPTRTPGAMSFHTGAFDPVRQLSITFGPNGTWDYGSIHAARSRIFFAPGCTSGNSPTLVLPPQLGPWLGSSFTISVSGTPPAASSLLLIGIDNRTYSGLPLPLPLAPYSPQCRLAVSVLATQLMLPVPPALPLPTTFIGLPNSPVFAGVHLYVQAAAFYLDPVNGLSISISDAADCEAGLR